MGGVVNFVQSSEEEVQISEDGRISHRNILLYIFLRKDQDLIFCQQCSFDPKNL